MLINISKKTKIVCTIGPSTDNYDAVLKLINAGMNVMRVNFSHGSYEEHIKKVQIARQIEKDTGCLIPVMLDTKGPEIRTHFFENDSATILKNDIVRISMKEVLGTAKKFSITYPELYDDVQVGNIIKLDDGNLDLLITEKDDINRELVTIAQNTHTVTNRRGVNVPYIKLSMPFISEKDANDIKFGCENDFDLIAASFVRREQDILDVKELCKKYNRPNMKIIAKIENPEGVSNIDKIIEVADGIMVARGDLGVEIPAEEVPVIQKMIIDKCRLAGKPVITATQMLDSMKKYPRPTRAEVSDVANAVTQGTDAVMLSAESASGDYPIEATTMQSKIASTMEKYLDYEKLAQEAFDTSEKTNNDAIAISVANTAALIGAKLIVCFSESGSTALRISKSRPVCNILAISNDRRVCLDLALSWGVNSLYAPFVPQLIEEMEVLALVKAHMLGIKAGEPIIVTGGTPTGAGKTNFMKIINVNEIKDI